MSNGNAIGTTLLEGIVLHFSLLCIYSITKGFVLPVPDCAMFFKSVKVFRCQLPRDNPFYPSEPPKKDSTEPPEARGSI